MERSDRPNILFFMTDQLAPFVLEPYRSGMAITPTIRQVAERGTTFTNAYCNNPLCTPSRASMMSGQLASDVGVYDNGSPLLADVPCFTHALRRAGYHTVLSGKMHFVGPDQMHGFNERTTTDVYPSDFAWTTDWSGGVPGGDKINAVFDAGPDPKNKYLSYDDEATHRAIEWLRRYSRSDKLQEDPFFMCVSLTAPHHPYGVPNDVWEMYEGREIPEPDVGPIPYDKLTNSHDRWLYQALRLNETEIPPEVTQRARRAYCAYTTYLDQKLAQVLRTLEDLGMSENTWIVFTSDHGDMIGERGMWYKKVFYEYSSRVPLIITPPQGSQARESDEVVSLVDLFPTMTAVGQAEEPPGDRPGQSLLPCLDGEVRDRHCIMEYMGSSVLSPMRMVREGQYKLVYIHTDDGPEEELYDLEADPNELKNLIDDPEHKATAERLRELVFADGWDGRELHQTILANQKKRLFLRDAMRQKLDTTRWKHVPTLPDPNDPLVFRA